MSPEFPPKGLSCSSATLLAWKHPKGTGQLALTRKPGTGGAGDHRISPRPVLLTEVSPFFVLLGNT